MKKLTKTQSRDIRAIATQKDEDIDFSDAPPVLDWAGAEMGKFLGPILAGPNSDGQRKDSQNGNRRRIKNR